MLLDSAGTGHLHVGAPPYGAMQAAARVRGYDMSDLRARLMSVAEFQRFDLIPAMDAENRIDLVSLAQRQSQSMAQVRMLTDSPGDDSADHAPDPYFTRGFDEALTLIERCAEGLLDQL